MEERVIEELATRYELTKEELRKFDKFWGDTLLGRILILKYQIIDLFNFR